MVELVKIEKVIRQWVRLLDPGQFFWNETNDSLGMRVNPIDQSTYFCFKREKFLCEEIQVIPIHGRNIKITFEV